MKICDIDHLHKRFLDIWEWCMRQGFDTRAFTYVENAFKSEPTAELVERKTENCSEKPNNWRVEYAEEMLDTMSCEECGHWEHGAGDHYYCALLEMGQECYFESKNESTLMFANEPKTEPQKCYLRKSCDHYGDKQVCGRCRHYNLYSHTKDEPQTDYRITDTIGYRCPKCGRGNFLSNESNCVYCGEPLIKTDCHWK